MSAQHMLDTMAARADAQVAAYARSPRRYVIGRRDAALINASNPTATDVQVAYWNRIADGMGALLKARKTTIAKATGSPATIGG